MKSILILLLLTLNIYANVNESNVFVQSGGTSPVASVYSKNNKLLVTADMNKMIYIWDVQTAQEVNRINLSKLTDKLYAVKSLTFTNNKNHLLVRGFYIFILLDIKKNKIINTFDKAEYSFAKPYGEFIYTSDAMMYSKGINKLNIYDGSSSIVVDDKEAITNGSKNGRYLITSRYIDNNVFNKIFSIYDIEDDFEKTYEWESKGTEENLAFNKANISNDGKYLFISKSKTSELIDLDNESIVKTMSTIKGDSIPDILIKRMFSKDSKSFYYVYSNSGLWELDISSLSEKLIRNQPSTSIKEPLNKNFLLAGANLIDLGSLKIDKTYAHPSTGSKTSYFHNDILHLDTGSIDMNNFNKFTLNSAKKVLIVKDIDFQKNNYITQENKVDILKSFNTQKILMKFDDSSMKYKFSKDGKYLLRQTIAMEMNKTYNLKMASIQHQLWNIKTKELLHTFKNVSMIGRIIFSDNENIAWQDDKQKIQIFNIAKGLSEEKTLNVVGLINLKSANSNYFVFESLKRIFFIDSQTNDVLHTQSSEMSYVSLFSPDNNYYFTITQHGAYLYDIKNNFKSRKIKIPGGFFFSSHISFSKGSKFMSIKGIDYVSIYNIKTNKKVDLYTFEEKKEWIAITENGYFTGSQGAEKYLKVRNSNGVISSLDQYYSYYYRPDIVASSMKSANNTQYAAPTQNISDIKLAPKVTIVDTKQDINKEELKVTLKITPNSGGVGQIRLYIDNVLVKTDGDRGLKARKDSSVLLKSYTMKLSQGEHTIKAIVLNEENTMESKPDTLLVISTYAQTSKPNIYAVVIGINEYKNPAIALKYAVADAELFARTIKKRTKGLYGDVKVELLTTKKQTSKENITKTLKDMENISPNDLFIFFVASHGMIEDAKYHMITSNVGALSTRGIKREAISQESLRDMIANIPTTKKFIILDTCNSGALGEAIEVALLTRGLTETTAMKVLSRAVGSTIISASSSSQEALEGYKGHGLLTYVLTDGLNGKADSDKDGYIKTLEIANFVEDMVPEIAEREFKRAQYPFVSPLGQGFPLVKVK